MIACQFHNNSMPSSFMNALQILDVDYTSPINNIWHIQSHHSIDNIQQHLLSVIEINDSLIITEVSEQRQYTPENEIQISHKPSFSNVLRQRLFA